MLKKQQILLTGYGAAALILLPAFYFFLADGDLVYGFLMLGVAAATALATFRELEKYKDALAASETDVKKEIGRSPSLAEELHLASLFPSCFVPEVARGSTKQSDLSLFLLDESAKKIGLYLEKELYVIPIADILDMKFRTEFIDKILDFREDEDTFGLSLLKKRAGAPMVKKKKTERDPRHFCFLTFRTTADKLYVMPLATNPSASNSEEKMAANVILDQIKTARQGTKKAQDE